MLCVLGVRPRLRTKRQSRSTNASAESFFSLSPVPAPPRDTTNRVDGNPQAIALGKALFSDTRLSGDGKFSCASCHDPARRLDRRQGRCGRRRRRARVIRHRSGTRRTTAGISGTVAQIRCGRRRSSRSSATSSSNSSRLQVAHVIHRDPKLRASYEQLFGKLPELATRSAFRWSAVRRRMTRIASRIGGAWMPDDRARDHAGLRECRQGDRRVRRHDPDGRRTVRSFRR